MDLFRSGGSPSGREGHVPITQDYLAESGFPQGRLRREAIRGQQDLEDAPGTPTATSSKSVVGGVDSQA
jgi:hypothetical protein